MKNKLREKTLFFSQQWMNDEKRKKTQKTPQCVFQIMIKSKKDKSLTTGYIQHKQRKRTRRKKHKNKQ